MRICITGLYYILSNFCKTYEEWERSYLLPSNKERNRTSNLNLAELMTILLYFYRSPCKDFKNYYLYHLPVKYKGYFKYVSYSRIIQLWPRMIMPLTILMHFLSGEETGIYFVDSSKLQICHNKRTSSNKVFGKKASMGKSSYGWFMGFKLHIIINNKGSILAIKITKGNVSDISVIEQLSKNLVGRIYGDKGYISKEIFNNLFKRGLTMITGIRKTMKNHLMYLEDKIYLRKRSLVESVFNNLKNNMNIEHTRHRSPLNFLTHIIACCCAFNLKYANLNITSLS